jgi:hypothetical protein
MEVSGLVWRRELRKVQFVNFRAWMLHSFMSICECLCVDVAQFYVHLLFGIQKCLAETELGLKMIVLSDNFINFISISYITKYALTALF